MKAERYLTCVSKLLCKALPASLFLPCGLSCCLSGLFPAVVSAGEQPVTAFVTEGDVLTGSTESGDNSSSQSASDVDRVLASMTLEDKVAQMFFVTLDGLTGVSGTQIAGDITRESLRQFHPGGVSLFGGNIGDPDQLAALTAALQEYSLRFTGIPLLIGTDEEGGLVKRIGSNGNFDVPYVGTMQSVGETGDPSQAYMVGDEIGAYLAEYGVNMDFAPDADVLSNSANTVIGSRSFGSDPALVSEMTEQYRKGLLSHGVIPCLKHFPGHGATTEDSHTGFAMTDKNMDQLMECELVPFKTAIENGADCIMAAHISLPSVTGDRTPASLSPVIINGLLRETLGFDGVVLTDALNMGAVTNWYNPPQAAILAVQAGNDMLLTVGEFREQYLAVLNSVKDGTIPEERIDGSVRRILTLKLNHGLVAAVPAP